MRFENFRASLKNFLLVSSVQVVPREIERLKDTINFPLSARGNGIQLGQLFMRENIIKTKIKVYVPARVFAAEV